MTRILLCAALLFGASLLKPQPAECAICVWSGTCYSHSTCGQGCVCVKPDGIGPGGVCRSL